MTIELVTFDLDDTLWDTAPVIVRAETVLGEWLAANAPKLGVIEAVHFQALRERILGAQPQLKHRISALRRRVLFHALHEAGYPQADAQALADQAFEVFLEARHALEVFAQVEPTLSALARDYALGVVTNGNADVRRIGLGHHFKFVLCAEDIGIAKPDARLFHEALSRGGVAAHAAVHVGDHPGDDIAGAQQAGLRAVWFNPGGKSWDGDKRPDAEIGCLSELAQVLNHLK
ncbi:HAD family hydrolase [Pseudomonas weihenstephanensis]|uniref:HAD family hydrolase n=1 Tax=Pseudomonas weihenstephanensis TaxID=1608994 RepID=A0A0J6IPB0_9PSED|nr:HAD-IA family hydrolase [Pseudomonas weihenstephanensis]KMN13994.1 HAD family hydrolase [Pseudomonas weihenstephanensis]MBM1191209.1 HAD-IA family hydrolase [Pseudomonas weihenstephanensis]GLX89749.1 haloacid dehalogenase [Pseudomonas fragi]